MPSFDAPSMARGHKSLFVEKYNSLVWSLEPGQRSGYGSTKKGARPLTSTH